MFHHSTRRIATTLLLLSTALLPATGQAASYLDTRPKAQKTSYTASLAEITRGDTARRTHILDWRQPALQLYFDLPPAERTSDIVLTLSADPLTRVSRNAPLQVQLNNSKPVPVISNGKGFEARIPFNAASARQRRNSLRIIYPKPAGEACVTPAHGKWSIDLAASTLKMSGRARLHNMSLRDVEDRLAQPALSPKTVGLIAHGPDGTDMQALAAQGIALRTPGVPKFSVTERGNDFNVVMVTRDRLFGLTDDPMILNSKGARIFVAKGQPTQLIFTADTDAEILKMLATFSTRHLPETRRPITSLGEINLQNRLDRDVVHIERKAHLSDLVSGQSITNYRRDSRASGAQTYRFSVADPDQTEAELLLRLTTINDVADTSRLRVALNGEVLGAAKLDRKRKSVAFDIKAGTLNASSNVLSILPDLDAKPGYGCPSNDVGRPGFTIGQGSRLTLTQIGTSPITELSKLTATGGVFADSESYVILPRGTRDYQAALGVLGQIAKSAGHGLTLANYTRKDDAASNAHKLVIGPAGLANRYADGAPKALREALQGSTIAGDNLLSANIERFASSGADDFAVQFAAAQDKPRKIQRGGVAALYGTGNGKLTGIISATAGDSFIRASRQLIQPTHWNAVRGGVSRWNNTSVLMAQTARPAMGVKLPGGDRKLNLPQLGLPHLDLPEIQWPDFDMPQVSTPQFSLPKINWPTFRAPQRRAEKVAVQMQPAIEPSVEPAQFLTKATKVATPVKIASVSPRLKPTPTIVRSAKPKTAPAGLRGTFNLDRPKTAERSSFHDLRRKTQLKWGETKSWVRAKTSDIKNADILSTLEQKVDRLQDRVTPAGRSMRVTAQQNVPGKGLIALGDRTVSAYGLLLMLAFALVLILMTMAGPSSRLGGRH